MHDIRANKPPAKRIYGRGYAHMVIHAMAVCHKVITATAPQPPSKTAHHQPLPTRLGKTTIVAISKKKSSYISKTISMLY